MEHVDVIIEPPDIEPQELSAAYLDIAMLYEWLDRPVTEEDDDLSS
ncbi:hypothetical protein MNBD_GAMMA24-715 [hydrothermal vent metagenome]|uniref:Uncharacterized protein n=1 Tax=hydrothermal vent metagenome TaxID=652676 RepID=A0A3B1BPQ1_9ZZZZ